MRRESYTADCVQLQTVKEDCCKLLSPLTPPNTHTNTNGRVDLANEISDRARVCSIRRTIDDDGHRRRWGRTIFAVAAHALSWAKIERAGGRAPEGNQTRLRVHLAAIVCAPRPVETVVQHKGRRV